MNCCNFKKDHVLNRSETTERSEDNPVKNRKLEELLNRANSVNKFK